MNSVSTVHRNAVDLTYVEVSGISRPSRCPKRAGIVLFTPETSPVLLAINGVALAQG